MSLNGASVVKQKIGLTIRWSQLVYRLSYKKWDLRYTGIAHCVHSPT